MGKLAIWYCVNIADLKQDRVSRPKMARAHFDKWKGTGARNQRSFF